MEYTHITECEFVGNRQGLLPSILQIWWVESATSVTNVSVDQCVFEENGDLSEFNWPIVGFDNVDAGQSLAMIVENSLFVRNKGPAVGHYPVPIIGGPRSGEGIVDLRIRGNTIAKSERYSLGTAELGNIPSGSTIERNLITGGVYGLSLTQQGEGVTVSCNLSWGNGTNWLGFPDPSGQEGNFSAPPKYCNPEIDDFTVASNSPCLPGNNSCLELIGAFPDGCGPISVTPTSWGRVKSLYR